MKFFVADSYKNMDRVGEPFEKGGHLYTKVQCKCDHCVRGIYPSRIENGKPVPHPAYGGVCLKCGGTGIISKEVRLYTEKEYNQQVRARNRRTELAEQKRIERAAEISRNRFHNWLKWNGFNENEETYLIYGNTYPIKDQLKEQGFKFSKELKWHGVTATEVPEDCYIEKIHWSDVYNWNQATGDMEITEKGQSFLDDIFSAHTLGQYIGEIGERLRSIPVVFDKMITFEGKYGEGKVYRFNCDGAQLSWFTSVDKDLEEGEVYTLTGTVKDHKVYGNVKTTYLSRCIIK